MSSGGSLHDTVATLITNEWLRKAIAGDPEDDPQAGPEIGVTDADDLIADLKQALRLADCMVNADTVEDLHRLAGEYCRIRVRIPIRFPCDYADEISTEPSGAQPGAGNDDEGED